MQILPTGYYFRASPKWFIEVQNWSDSMWAIYLGLIWWNGMIFAVQKILPLTPSPGLTINRLQLRKGVYEALLTFG